MYDVIIIGGGPAGLSAAIYAARYNLSTMVLYTDYGLIASALSVENYPGFGSISGTDLISKFQDQAKSQGAELYNKDVTKVRRLKKCFKVFTLDKKVYESKSIMIASGAKHMVLGVSGEKKFLGKGVSYCAICDAPLFSGKQVAVAGWQSSAVVSASILARFARKVYLLAKPSKVPEHLLAGLPDNVEVLTRAEVKEITGSKFVESVILKDGKHIDVSGIFINIGFKPSAELAEMLGAKIVKGLIKVNASQATSVPGVFAAGDITTNSNEVRQVLTAAAEGCIAATSAYTFITGKVSKMQMSHKQ